MPDTVDAVNGDDAGVVRAALFEGANGPLWATASADLNVTLLAWDEGRGTPEHVNREADVLVVCLAGSGTVSVGGRDERVGAGDLVLVERGRRRRITAGRDGIRYLSVHRRRPPLAIRPLER